MTVYCLRLIVTFAPRTMPSVAPGRRYACEPATSTTVTGMVRVSACAGRPNVAVGLGFGFGGLAHTVVVVAMKTIAPQKTSRWSHARRRRFTASYLRDGRSSRTRHRLPWADRAVASGARDRGRGTRRSVRSVELPATHGNRRRSPG